MLLARRDSGGKPSCSALLSVCLTFPSVFFNFNYGSKWDGLKTVQDRPYLQRVYYLSAHCDMAVTFPINGEPPLTNNNMNAQLLIKVAANYFSPQHWCSFTNDFDYLPEAITTNKIFVTHQLHVTGASWLLVSHFKLLIADHASPNCLLIAKANSINWRANC